MTEVATPIAAEAQAVWDILLDKVFHPERYVPGILSCRCKERAPGEYVRSLETESDEVVELILVDENARTITSNMVRHALLSGSFVQRLETLGDGTVRLVFEEHREIREEALRGLDLRPAVEAALLQIKEIAEK